MLSLGLNVHVIEPLVTDRGLVTDVEGIKQKIDELGKETILAIHTTISCFAPRQPDSLDAISQLRVLSSCSVDYIFSIIVITLLGSNNW